MIDKSGFRLGVGIIIVNKNQQVFWAKRIGQNAWQFPQGGMNANETPEQAMYRELHEETGLRQQDVKLLGCTRRWLRYRLPQQFIRRYTHPSCVGQKQRWFLLQLMAHDRHVNFTGNGLPEFDDWQWQNYWYPLQHVIGFKRRVYLQALKELSKKLRVIV